MDLLSPKYYWFNMKEDVWRVIAACTACSTAVNAEFTSHPPRLQPLSIEGRGYRWGIDLAGPFNRSAAGNVYAMHDLCVLHQASGARRLTDQICRVHGCRVSANSVTLRRSS
jgi:hypothetical protein